MRFILSLLGFVALLGTPALALEVQPGLWQDTETAELNGKAQPPSVTTDCIKPADAKDIVKTAQAQMKESMKDQSQQCSKLDIKENGNVILFEMKCGDPKQGSIDATMSMTINSPQSTSSVVKSTMSLMGQKMVTSTRTESKWIAASCDKK
jgi:hypothetical protein